MALKMLPRTQKSSELLISRAGSGVSSQGSLAFVFSWPLLPFFIRYSLVSTGSDHPSPHPLISHAVTNFIIATVVFIPRRLVF